MCHRHNLNRNRHVLIPSPEPADDPNRRSCFRVYEPDEKPVYKCRPVDTLPKTCTGEKREKPVYM